MKFRGILLSILVVIICCGPSFSEGNAPRAAIAKHSLHSQFTQSAIEPLNYGETVAGSIPAPAVANDCLLSDRQYRIEYPGGAHKLVIQLQANQDVDLYVRAGSPVTNENGNVMADFKSATSRKTESLSLPLFTAVLERGTYFIAVTNCGPGAADYTLIAQVLDPPDADTVALNLSSVEVGSVPAPEPGLCRISRTQYVGSSSFAPCAGSFSWFVTIRADQNINVYIRKNKPVALENGLVIYDRVTTSPAKVQFVSLDQNEPGQSLFYVAVENCNFEAVNYSVAAGGLVGDAFPPFIANAFFDKKDLHVIGQSFNTNSVVLLDGQPQQTIYSPLFPFQDRLIVKKAKKKIERRQTVRVTVAGGGCTSGPFLLTRP